MTLREIRIADDLGGRSYCVFRGLVADLEAAVELAVEALRSPDLLAGQVVIPQLHGEMDDNLITAPEKEEVDQPTGHPVIASSIVTSMRWSITASSRISGTSPRDGPRGA